MATEQKQTIELGLTKMDMGREQRAVLEIGTDKGFRGGVKSDARVMWLGDGFRSCLLYGDYAKTLKTTPGRCTQQAIDRQHAEVFTPDAVQALVAEAKGFYAKAVEDDSTDDTNADYHPTLAELIR